MIQRYVVIIITIIIIRINPRMNFLLRLTPFHFFYQKSHKSYKFEPPKLESYKRYSIGSFPSSITRNTDRLCGARRWRIISGAQL